MQWLLPCSIQKIFLLNVKVICVETTDPSVMEIFLQSNRTIDYATEGKLHELC